MSFFGQKTSKIFLKEEESDPFSTQKTLKIIQNRSKTLKKIDFFTFFY